MTKQRKQRLDDLLIERGEFSQRDEVLRAAIAGDIKVDDVRITSSAELVMPDAHIEIARANRYVSRGGIKLEGALAAFNQKVEGLRAIDVGSSTGGFSDCLLQAGAAEVTCVDVNYSQLAWKIREHPRTVVFERTNIRTADPTSLGAPFDIIVADLSFIGLAQLASVFAHLGQSGSVFIGLIKPQFESKHEETEQGVVKDPRVRARTINEVTGALEEVGFDVTGVVESPIAGKRGGNIEYLVRAVLR